MPPACSSRCSTTRPGATTCRGSCAAASAACSAAAGTRRSRMPGARSRSTSSPRRSRRRGHRHDDRVARRRVASPHAWQPDDAAKSSSRSCRGRPGAPTSTLAQDGSGKPWITVQSLAAIPLKEPLSTRLPHHARSHAGRAEDEGPVDARRRRARAPRDRGAVRHDLGRRRRSDARRARRCSAAGSAATRRCSTQGEKRDGLRLAGVRGADASRASAPTTGYVPKGRFVVEYTVRLNNAGRFHAAADARRGDVRARDVRRAAERGLSRSRREPADARIGTASRLARCVGARRCRGAAARADTALPSFADVKAAYVTSDVTLLDRHGTPMSEVRVDATVAPAALGARSTTCRRRWRRRSSRPRTGASTSIAASTGRARRRRVGQRVAHARRPAPARRLDADDAARRIARPALAPPGATRTLGQKWARRRRRSRSSARGRRADPRGLSQPRVVSRRARRHRRARRRPSSASTRAASTRARRRSSRRWCATRTRRAATVAQRACAVATLANPASRCADVARDRPTTALARAYAIAPRWNDAPHVAARLLTTPGERLASTLDADLQRFAAAALRERLAELAGRNVDDGALVVLDNATGDVLAYVGSAGELSSAPQVDGVTALRQPGSTLKPFLYELAIERGVLTAGIAARRLPVAIATERGLYVPQNYDRDFKGLVSVRTALASSLNVPAVRTLELVGVDRFLGTLQRARLRHARPRRRLLRRRARAGRRRRDAARAHQRLPHARQRRRGRADAIHRGAERRRRPAHRVASTAGAASFIVSDILADRGARALSFGLENPLATRAWSAVKTGTSKDMRDNWCVGFTRATPSACGSAIFRARRCATSPASPARRRSGATSCSGCTRRDASMPPAAPAGVARRTVAFLPPVESARDEWFVRGTEMDVVRSEQDAGHSMVGVDSAGATPRIRYPAAGAVIALDPDIPDAAQRVVFEAAPAIEGLRWRLDGVEIAGGSRRGRAELGAGVRPAHARARGRDGQARFPRVAFEVRGHVADAWPSPRSRPTDELGFRFEIEPPIRELSIVQPHRCRARSRRRRCMLAARSPASPAKTQCSGPTSFNSPPRSSSSSARSCPWSIRRAMRRSSCG